MDTRAMLRRVAADLATERDPERARGRRILRAKIAGNSGNWGQGRFIWRTVVSDHHQILDSYPIDEHHAGARLHSVVHKNGV